MRGFQKWMDNALYFSLHFHMNSEFPLDISISLYCSDLWHLTKWQFIAEIQHWFCIRELVHWICCINRLIQQMKIKHTLWETSQQPGIGKELPQLHRSHIKKKIWIYHLTKAEGVKKSFLPKVRNKAGLPTVTTCSYLRAGSSEKRWKP